MYTENEFMTPRERINDELLRRAVDDASPLPRANNARPNCMGEESSYSPMPQRSTWGLENYPLASVYAPMQIWRNLYDPETALERGTLFKELDLPFVCGEINEGGNCCGR